MNEVEMWRDMDCFKGIDLEDTIVLSWSQTNNHVVFQLEVSIWPESPHYEAPKINEYTCYKKGVLKFSGTSNVQGLKEQAHAISSIDTDGSIDYGNIDYLGKTASGFEVVGEFGSVHITGGELSFEIYA